MGEGGDVHAGEEAHSWFERVCGLVDEAEKSEQAEQRRARVQGATLSERFAGCALINLVQNELVNAEETDYSYEYQR